MPSSSQRRIIGRNQVSLAVEADQELLTTPAGRPWPGRRRGRSSTERRPAARCRCPTPLAPIARATSSLAPGATPTGAPPALPPTMVPAVWVPWPLSSIGVGLPPTKSCQPATLPARSSAGGVDAGVDGADRDALAAHAERRPRRPARGSPSRPQSPLPASGNGMGAASARGVGDRDGRVEVDRLDGGVGGDGADLVGGAGEGGGVDEPERSGPGRRRRRRPRRVARRRAPQGAQQGARAAVEARPGQPGREGGDDRDAVAGAAGVEAVGEGRRRGGGGGPGGAREGGECGDSGEGLGDAASVPAPRAVRARDHSNPFRRVVRCSPVIGIPEGRLDRRGRPRAPSLPWVGARVPVPPLRLSRERFRAERPPPAARLLALRLRLRVRAARGLLRQPEDRAHRLRPGAADPRRRPLVLRGHGLRRGRPDRPRGDGAPRPRGLPRRRPRRAQPGVGRAGDERAVHLPLRRAATRTSPRRPTSSPPTTRTVACWWR